MVGAILRPPLNPSDPPDECGRADREEAAFSHLCSWPGGGPPHPHCIPSPAPQHFAFRLRSSPSIYQPCCPSPSPLLPRCPLCVAPMRPPPCCRAAKSRTRQHRCAADTFRVDTATQDGDACLDTCHYTAAQDGDKCLDAAPQDMPHAAQISADFQTEFYSVRMMRMPTLMSALVALQTVLHATS